MVLIVDQHVYVANAGDSRTILKNSREIIELSVDHKPELENEAQRIQMAGGYGTFF